MILCLGDSLTRGLVGHTYIKYMPPGQCKNGGLDGDTAHGALRRLHIYRKMPWYSQVDTCVVGIGTNDLLQPYLMARGLVWRLVFRWRRSWKEWADIPEYEGTIRQILDTLTADGKRPVVMGLPLMQLKDYPMDELRARNMVLERLAGEYGVPFADVLTAQLNAVPSPRTDYDWGRIGAQRLLDILVMGLLPSTKDGFSRRRGLELTVDGVHFNSVSARLAAGAVKEKL